MVADLWGGRPSRPPSFRDTASAAVLERLRNELRNGTVDVVLAYSLDRLSLSQNYVGILDAECQRHGIRLEFVTERFEDTPVERFVRSARAFTDEIEREKIRERTTRGKRHRMSEGRFAQGTGTGIFGYTYSPVGRGGDRKRYLHLEQAAVVRRIFDELIECGSVSAVTDRLNVDCVHTQRTWGDAVPA